MPYQRLIHLTNIALGLALLLFIFGIFHPPEVTGKVEWNSIVILCYAIFTNLLCMFRFIRAFRKWRDMEPDWKKAFGRSYLFSFIFAALLPVIYANIHYDKYPVSMFNFIAPLSFMFTLGVCLISIGFMAIKYRHSRKKSFLLWTLLPGFIFTLLFSIPFLMFLFWFLNGPDSIMPPCYCPVNRRTRMRELFKRSKFNRRKERLREQLCLCAKSL